MRWLHGTVEQEKMMKDLTEFNKLEELLIEACLRKIKEILGK